MVFPAKIGILKEKPYLWREFIQDMLQTLWDLVRRYKYVITLLAFGILIVFVDENNLIHRWQLRREAVQLQSEISDYRRQYEQATLRLQQLEADSTVVERIAREQYLMQKDGEDVFVFPEDVKP